MILYVSSRLYKSFCLNELICGSFKEVINVRVKIVNEADPSNRFKMAAVKNYKLLLYSIHGEILYWIEVNDPWSSAVVILILRVIRSMFSIFKMKAILKLNLCMYIFTFLTIQVRYTCTRILLSLLFYKTTKTQIIVKLFLKD